MIPEDYRWTDCRHKGRDHEIPLPESKLVFKN